MSFRQNLVCQGWMFQLKLTSTLMQQLKLVQPLTRVLEALQVRMLLCFKAKTFIKVVFLEVIINIVVIIIIITAIAFIA